MEHNNRKFRLRLNLFDCIVFILALIAIAVMFWFSQRLSDSTIGDYEANIHYTVRISETIAGISSRIHPGDVLVDAIRNGGMGTVTDVKVYPSQTQVLDQKNRQFVMAPLDGYEDVELTVQASVSVGEGTITIGEGTSLRVGSTLYLRGPGYMGSGPVVAINREGTTDWGKVKSSTTP